MTRADNHGRERHSGFAFAGLSRKRHEAWAPKLAHRHVVVFGEQRFLYGDRVITPAISVLSATEGLIVAAPWLEPFTVPLTILILVALFSFQRNGTESVAKLFGPIMLVGS